MDWFSFWYGFGAACIIGVLLSIAYGAGGQT